MALSLAIITYNEEENIVRLLDSLTDIVDEIIIVDSFSTDKTKEICTQKYPQVKFFEKKNLMGMVNKNHALALCSHEWVLFLDADEVPDETLKRSIQRITSSGSTRFNVYK